MKSARERAEAMAAGMGLPMGTADAFERMLLEYGRDQRHLCAEAVHVLAEPWAHGVDADASLDVLADRAHALVMNTPAPGHVLPATPAPPAAVSLGKAMRYAGGASMDDVARSIDCVSRQLRSAGASEVDE
jgi:hypothetical protein